MIVLLPSIYTYSEACNLLDHSDLVLPTIPK